MFRITTINSKVNNRHAVFPTFESALKAAMNYPRTTITTLDGLYFISTFNISKSNTQWMVRFYRYNNPKETFPSIYLNTSLYSSPEVLRTSLPNYQDLNSIPEEMVNIINN